MNADAPHVVFLKGAVLISTPLSLEDVARILSQSLSVSFNKDTKGVFEEIPAYYADVFGLRLVITPTDTTNLSASLNDYVLDVYPKVNSHLWQIAHFEEVNISTFLATLLGDVSGLKITAAE